MSTEDKEVGAILRRHHEDAAWFSGGLHDPHGYIALAHKDRGELLAKLRMLRTGEAAGAVPEGMMVIPVAAYDWLMGQGPDDMGKHFGDDLVNRSKMPAYWWRSIFNRMCAKASAPKVAA
jgi:hypothetical protein